jgi:hypothetical protein
MMTDPIADMLTRIRNANRVERPAVEMPATNLKVALAKVLLVKADALGAVGRHRQARGVLRQASEIFHRDGLRQHEAACWRRIGEMHLAEGNVRAAASAFQSGLSAVEGSRTRA